jgi:hypothetical protein
MTDEGYNGWRNYETWLVGLWFDNDEGLYNEARRIARRAKDRYDAGQALKDLVEEMNTFNDRADVFSDLLNAALSEVDWYEIGDHFTDNEGEEEEDDNNDS